MMSVASPERKTPRSAVQRGWLSATVFGVPLLGAAAALVAYRLTHNLLAVLLFCSLVTVFVCFNLGAQTTTGIFLLLIPTNWFVITLLHFYGVHQFQAISAMKEVFLAVAFAWFLAHARNMVFTGPDLFLFAALVIVFAEQVFVTNPKGARDDWEWVLPYFLGRVLILSSRTEVLWAKAAVWMCAVLSALGAYEVLFTNDDFRLLLVAVTSGEPKLADSFSATGYQYYRAASMMVSPLIFGGLCMIGLLLWWVYSKNIVALLLIVLGLVLTLTRSAIIGGILGVFCIAIRRKEYKRIFIFTIACILGSIGTITVLNLTRYLNATITGNDSSSQGHITSLGEGFTMMIDHPLGLGAGTVGPHTALKSSNFLNIESAILTIGVEYGILVALLLVFFLGTALWQMFRVRESIGYVGFAILLAFCGMLATGPIHEDVGLACWAWVPVGMAVARSTRSYAS